jgi:serine carboxypeptidase-like clade 1
MGAYYRRPSPLQRQLLPTAVLVLLAIAASSSGFSSAAAAAGRNVITHIKGFEGPLPFHLETG